MPAMTIDIIMWDDDYEVKFDNFTWDGDDSPEAVIRFAHKFWGRPTGTLTFLIKGSNWDRPQLYELLEIRTTEVRRLDNVV